MSEYNFVPITGLITTDSYMHGVGELEDINRSGSIVYVDENSFLLKTEDGRNILVEESSYWVFNEEDFK